VFIALFGGLAASFFLALSALTQWVLAQAGVAGSAGATRVLHWFAFATGGPGHVVPLGLLLAGISVTAGLTRRLPRWMMIFGLVVAAIAELSSFALVVPAAVGVERLADRFLMRPGFQEGFRTQWRSPQPEQERDPACHRAAPLLCSAPAWVATRTGQPRRIRWRAAG